MPDSPPAIEHGVTANWDGAAHGPSNGPEAATDR